MAQACEYCRSKKLRCDLGPVNDPQPPPCVRCRRERGRCLFSATRRRATSPHRETPNTRDALSEDSHSQRVGPTGHVARSFQAQQEEIGRVGSAQVRIISPARPNPSSSLPLTWTFLSIASSPFGVNNQSTIEKGGIHGRPDCRQSFPRVRANPWRSRTTISRHALWTARPLRAYSGW